MRNRLSHVRGTLTSASLAAPLPGGNIAPIGALSFHRPLPETDAAGAGVIQGTAVFGGYFVSLRTLSWDLAVSSISALPL
jgi:hypothetical protein